MIAQARQHYPGADLRVIDMRAVPQSFAGQRFEAILISFNSIDYIPWEDRAALLSGLRALLSDQGILAISTHRLDPQRPPPSGFEIPEEARPQARMLLRAPLEFAKRCVRCALWLSLGLPKHLRNRRRQHRGDGYAYINDSGEYYALLTVYVTPEAQILQLQAAGLRLIETLPGDRPDAEAFFDYYVTQCGP